MLADAAIGCFSALVLCLAALAVRHVVIGASADAVALIPPVCLTVRSLHGLLAGAR